MTVDPLRGMPAEPTARPRAVIAGASGFLGAALVRAFQEDGYTVVRIGRREAVRWDDSSATDACVDGADVLVNLAGASVNCRYTDANRREILESRLRTTRALHRAVSMADKPPRVWLNASTATIYRHESERANTEDNGIVGAGFSVDVARAWEDVFFEGSLPGTRRVALRMAIVLGDGPATAMLLRLARLGLGGAQIDGPWFRHQRYRGIGPSPTDDTAPGHRSRGCQRFSWIHLDDVIGATRFLRDHEELSGPVNLVSPGGGNNRVLMRALRRAVGAPIGLPAWRWMLEPAMWVLRTEPELVLKSRWVAPARLEEAGYSFVHADLDAALATLTRG